MLSRDRLLADRLRFRLWAGAGSKDAALKRAKPGRLGRWHVRSLAVLSLAAVLLAAFAAFLALPAQAQTPVITTLVSNGHLTVSSSSSAILQAQSFVTGANVDGYTVSEVGVYFTTASGRNTSAKIRKNNNNNLPGDLVATLTNPDTLTTASFNTFTAPADTMLDANTTYWISMNEDIASRKAFLGRVIANDETGETGWSIGDGRLSRNTASGAWQSLNDALQIEIRGTSGGTTTQSNDATLSSLNLSNVTLDPAFLAGTQSYTASVANSVTSTTVTAETTDANATSVVKLDGAVDTDGTVDLAVGNNTITVEVTAENTSTMLTYTVEVTRNVPPNLVVNPTSLTIGEAGSGTFTVKLATEPSSNVTVTVSSDDTGAATVSPASLTFTTSNWNTNQTVTVSGVNDTDTADESLTVSLSAMGGGYGGKTSTVSVSVTDNDTAGVTVSPTTLPVNEGSTGTYTVLLDTQPTATVTVTINDPTDNTDVTADPASLSFSTSNWSTLQTVTVRAAEDADSAQDTGTVTHTVSGGDYGSVTAADVAVTVTDNDTAGVTVSPTTLPVNEGSTGTYTVLLDTQPTATVTVTINDPTDNTDVTADPASLSFSTSNWSTLQTVTVRAAEDADSAQDTGTVTHTVSGGDYGSVTAADVAVTVTDNDTAGVTVSPTTLPVNEGSTGTYTVLLDTQPTATVTVTINDPTDNTDVTADPASLSFSTSNWSTLQTVTVRAAEDADSAQDTGTVTHTVSGGDYGSVTAADVAVTVTDNDTAGVTVSPTTLPVNEGSTGTYTVLLDTQPTATVTVTINDPTDNTDVTADPASLSFSTSNWSTLQTVTVRAAEDADSAQDTGTVTHTVSGGDYGSVTAADVAVTVTDNDTAGVTVSPTTLPVNEGSTGTYTVLLDTQPTATVTVTINDPTDNTDVTADPASLSFSTSNWSTLQTVTVRAAEDADSAQDTGTVTHTVSGGDYGSVTAADVAVTVTDNDTAGVTVSPTTLPVNEGSTGTYTVLLDTQPTATVTVTINDPTDNTDVTADPASLSFSTSNWSTLQTVTVRAAEDADSAQDTGTVTHTVSGGDYGSVTAADVAVTVTDNDTAGVTVSPTTLPVNEGSTGTYTVLLDTQPTATVTVTINDPTDNTDVTADPASLSFSTSNWSTLQTVTVRAAEDADSAQDTGTVTHTVSGGDYGSVTAADVAVTVTDNDTAGVTVSPTTLPVNEGSTRTYTVALNTQPSGSVTVAITSNNTDVTVSSSSLTFTTGNWNTAQTITVTAAQDTDAANDTAVLTHDPSGADYNSVSDVDLTVTVTDDDTAGVTVSPTTLPVNEGSTGTYTVLLDTQPTATVTVTINDPTDNTDVTADPASLSFSTSNWSTLQTVTVRAAEDADSAQDTGTVTHTVSGGDYGSVTAADVAVTVTDNDTAGVTVSPTTLPVNEGSTGTYTVLLDTQPTATVTVTINDPTDNTDVTADPASLSFSTSNWSTLQTVTVRAAEDADSAQDTGTVTHTVSGGDYGSVTAADVAVTVTDNDTAGVTVSPTTLPVNEGSTRTYTVALNTQPSGSVTVAITSNNTDVTVSSSSLTFTTGNWNTAQTITVTAAQDTDAANDTAVLTHDPSGADYNSVSDVDLTVTVTDDDTANAAPTFDDGGSTTRTFDETIGDTTVGTASNIGTPVSATDPDTGDTLEYSLEGTDRAKFTFDTSSGQIKTRAGESYDYEADSSYSVRVAVTDGTVTVSSAVTINVTDRNEPPPVMNKPVVTATANSTTSLEVSWTAPSNLGRPRIDSYDLQYRVGNTGDFSNGPQNQTGSSAAIGNLTADTSYEVQVRATNAEGDGVWSPSGTGTTGTTTITDPPGVTVSPTALTVTEEDMTGASYRVVLDSQPTVDVVITVAGHAGTEVTPSPTSLTFTTSNWDMGQTVTVTAGDDADTVNDTVTLTHGAMSADSNYNGITIASVTVTVIDNDDIDTAAGICGRTEEVRDALVALIPGVSDCAAVTDADLAAITGPLALSGESISVLAAGDFDGLTALEVLYLNNNELTTLPKDVFAGLTRLKVLTLYYNELTTLPDGVFGPLTALNFLYLGDNPRAPFAPTAVARPDAGTVSTSGGTVRLDGSGSGGPWGTNVTYRWALTTPASGVRVTFDDSTSATPEVTIPNLAARTELAFTLTVTGRGGTDGIETATATARVTATQNITNNPPVFPGGTVQARTFDETIGDTAVTSAADIGTPVSATEPDTGDTLEYRLEGTDRTKFGINATSGQIRTKVGESYDYEARTSYSVRVAVTDGTVTVSSAVTINVTDRNEPPPVMNKPVVTATANSTTSLEVSWTAPSNTGRPDIDSYDLQYRVGSTGDFSNGPQNQTGSSAAIGNLTADTEYEVQVRATNAEGDGMWSPSGTGQTNAEDNAAPTFNDGGSTTRTFDETIGDTAVTSAADIGTPVSATDPDTGDTLEYRLEGTDRTKFGINATSGQIRTKVGESYDYEARTSYSVRVAVTDGTVTVSSAVTINVTDRNEPPPVMNKPVVTATANSTTSLEVSWTAPSNLGRPRIDSYDLQYRVGNTGGFSNGPQNQTGSSAAIGNLTADTSYEVQVRATNAEGDGVWSPSGTGTTGTTTITDPPGVTVSPTALTVTEEDPTGASYRVVLDSQPTVDVVITVAGHAGTEVTPSPTSLTFTTSNWDTGQTVRVTAGDDADRKDDTVTLTHSAASTDGNYQGITIDDVTVTVNDDDIDTAAGICGRTEEVRDALVALIPGVSDCAAVTDADLAAITGTLNLSGQNIAVLAAGDFAGLTALTELYLNNNELTTLPEDVFAGLTRLKVLTLYYNELTTLPDGVFGPLTALNFLYLGDNPRAPFAPTAVARPDAGTVSTSGGTVRLDGSGSGGPWGTNVTYRWALTTPASGVRVTFDDSTSATPEVTIPNLAARTELAFTLTVTGRGGTDGIETATATARVTATQNITNNPPVFPGGTVQARTFDETMGDATVTSASDIGTPVSATEPDTGDRLTYVLLGADRDKFTFDTSSGQIRTKVGESYDYEARTSYSVRVAVTDGTVTVSSAVTINVTDEDEPPVVMNKPVVTATADSTTSLEVSWTAPSNTGRPDIDSYDLQYRVGSTGDFSNGPQNQTGSSAAIGNLTADTEYEVQVRATNAEGNSVWSPSGTGTTGTTTTTDPPGVTVSPTALTVTEEDVTGESYRVVLDSQPTARVTVTVAGHAGTEVTPSPASLTFTTSNWDTGQTVRVTAGSDADTVNDMVTLTHSAASADSDYDGNSITIASVAVTVTDNDTGNAAPTFNEGGSTTRTFDETIGDATVGTAADIGTPVSATDPDTGDTLEYRLEGTDRTKFGINATSGQIRTKVGENYDYEADSSYSVMVTVNDGTVTVSSAVTINVTDQDEPPPVMNKPVVTATANSTTSLEVSWTAPPNTGRPRIGSYDLQYRVGSNGGFINGPQNQTGGSAAIGNLTADTEYEVRVRATNAEGNGVWSPSGTGQTNPEDTDPPGVTVSEAALTVAEEDPNGESYRVVLDSQPTADVTVTVAGHAGTEVTPSPTSLTFTTSNWDTAQTVMVTAGSDADTVNDTVTLTHSAASTDGNYQGITIDDVTVTVNDDDEDTTAGICGRTEEVRDALVALIPGALSVPPSPTPISPPSPARSTCPARTLPPSRRGISPD